MLKCLPCMPTCEGPPDVDYEDEGDNLHLQRKIVPKKEAHGTIHSLSQEQSDALDMMLQELPEEAVKTDLLGILRTLRAHNFNVRKGLQWYRDMLEWRAKEGTEKFQVESLLNHLPDELYKYRQVVGGVVPNRNHLANKDMPCKEIIDENVNWCLHKHDKLGRPIYVEQIGRVDFTKMTKLATPEMIMHRHIWHMEHEILRMNMYSVKTGHVVEQTCNIIDLKHLSFNPKRHTVILPFFKAMMKLDMLLYPDRLGRVFYINTPKMFEVLFAISKAWIPKDVSARVSLLGGPDKYIPVLLQNIDAENLPKFYGGKCACNKECCIDGRIVY